VEPQVPLSGHIGDAGEIVDDPGVGRASGRYYCEDVVGPRIRVKRGTTFTWHFIGTVPHDVTLVSGPIGFSSPWTKSGTFSHTFSRPGTYRLFCSLHPARMTQIVQVRKG